MQICRYSLMLCCLAVFVNGQEREVEQTQHGPEFFFTEDFYMKVSKGVVVYVYESNSSRPIEKILLDNPAQSVKGSFINKTDLAVNIDWKSARFNGKAHHLSGLILKMNFKRKTKEYVMTGIMADVVVDDISIHDIQISAKTRGGLVVSAPLGTAFDCADLDVFPQAKATNDKYRIGLSFPKMKLQVMELKQAKFGPSWTCDYFMTIGVWIGLLVTLFFALVCYWGFSMLANIQTMDRFDDPKGKPIHVPQTE